MFKIKEVSFSYPDGVVGLSHVSADIGAGDRVAIVGANGSGKSTLLRAINGLVEPTAGTICFEGRPLTDRALREPLFQQEFRSRVGFVFQDADAQLFNATVSEEIAFAPSQLGLPPRELASRVEDVMAFLGISHLANRAPFRLSGGEKRKVAIASVLAMNPDAILFDEPVVGLDPRSQDWLVRTLNELQDAGKTTIVATHSLETLPLIADRALVLGEDHRLLASVPVEVMLDDVPLMRRANLISDTVSLHEPEICLN